MGLVAIIKYKLPRNTKTRQPSLSHRVFLYTDSSPLASVMDQQPFRGQYWVFFSNILNDCLEIFMDDFTPYEDAFETTLANLEKVLEHYE